MNRPIAEIPITARHRKVKEIIGSWLLKKGKWLSPGALLDLVRLGSESGPYEEEMGLEILDLVVSWLARYKPEHQYLLGIMADVLTGGRVVTRGQVELLSTAANQLPPRYKYKDLEGFNIEIVNRLEEMLRRFSKYEANCQWPLYLDTEHSHWHLPSGRKIAIITICDLNSSEITLFRVHQLGRREYGRVEKALCDLARRVRTATFGFEEVLRGASGYVKDLQLEKTKSLKDYAKDLGFTLKKSETMSDWTRPILRPDQVQYASMDALVLWKLQQDIARHPEK